MEAINITISRTYNDTLKAWLAFSRSSKAGKFWYQFRMPIVAIIIFLIFLKQNSPFTGTALSTSSALCVAVVFSVAVGWVISVLVKIAQENGVAKRMRGYPPEYFGEASITLEQSGLSVHAPLFQVQYNWKMLDSVLVTPEYLFICSGKGFGQSLVVWIPVNALGPQSANTISSVEEWLVESKQP